MTTLNKGDRVRMDTSEPGWLGTTVPDLGVGTVVATTEADDPFLMAGAYVGVRWDDPHVSSDAGRVAVGALIKVDE